MEYRQLFLTLFRKFDETKQPRSFLRDLVETAHLFLRMLERFCRGRAGLVVQVGRGHLAGRSLEGHLSPRDPVLVPQSKRVRRRKKKPVVAAAPAPQPPELEELWAALAPQLQGCLQVRGGPGAAGDTGGVTG